MAEPQKYIYELQYMLRKIAQTDGSLPPVNADGIYDEATRDAVRIFQTHNSLPVTGTVDKDTWDAIFANYKEAMYRTARPEPIYPFPSPTYTADRGEQSDIVTLIQIILSSLSIIYDDFEEVKITGINDDITQNALKRFQLYHGLPQTGTLDKSTWDAAARSFNTHYNHPNYI